MRARRGWGRKRGKRGRGTRHGAGRTPHQPFSPPHQFAQFNPGQEAPPAALGWEGKCRTGTVMGKPGAQHGAKVARAGGTRGESSSGCGERSSARDNASEPKM